MGHEGSISEGRGEHQQTGETRRVESKDASSQDTKTFSSPVASKETETRNVKTNPLPSPEIRPLLRTNSLNLNTTQLRSHARSSSLVNPSTQRKRLSLSFPINPSSNNASPRYIPATASPLSPAIAIAPTSPAVVDPSDGSSFLTALAAQERRVLELKQELSKAESELSRMQHLWAVYEGERKRKEIEMMENIRKGRINAHIDEATRLEEEKLREQMAARKLAAQKAMNRRSFPGQKHTRTLSLLSPPFSPEQEKPNCMETPKQDSSSESDKQSRPSTEGRTSRPLSIVDLSVVPKAGRQIAEEFKEGFWTFLEDLRQATVGDEATSESWDSNPDVPSRQNSGTSLRSQGSRQSKSSSSRSADSRGTGTVFHTADGDFYDGRWSGEMRRRARGRNSADSETLQEAMEEDEVDNRKVSNTRWSTGTVYSEAPGLTSRNSTPRTSTRYIYRSPYFT